MTYEQKGLPPQGLPPQKIITMRQDGSIVVDPDNPIAYPHDLVSVPLKMPRGGERRILTPAGITLDVDGSPIKHNQDGVTRRLDGATVVRLGGTAIDIPAEQQ